MTVWNGFHITASTNKLGHYYYILEDRIKAALDISCIRHKKNKYLQIVCMERNNLSPPIIRYCISFILSSVPISHSKPNLVHQFSAQPCQCLPLDSYPQFNLMKNRLFQLFQFLHNVNAGYTILSYEGSLG